MFTKDLLANPVYRNVHDVKHIVAAAASSSSQSRAAEFLKAIKAPSEAKAYGSYAELVKDPDVDIIYVATPHSHHFQNTMLALEAGKHVLCEKAFTINALQAKKLVETATAKKLFLMEAMWTRYFPLTLQIRERVTRGEIGKVHRVVAEFSESDADGNDDLNDPSGHRLINPDLGGGSLLDKGIYAITWCYLMLYHMQSKPRQKPKILAAINKYAKTGVDESTAIIFQWEKQNTMGVALAAHNVDSNADTRGWGDLSKSDFDGPCVRIQGSKGDIHVYGTAYRPTRYRVILHGDPLGKILEVPCRIPKDPVMEPRRKDDDAVGWGHGLFWEADEAARCVRDGKLESEGLEWEESIVIMEAMDEIRQQGGLTYPDLIESAEFDPQSPLNVR